MLLISAIVLVVFGPDKLPEVARVLGKATREFRKITSTAQRTWDEIGREMELQEARAQAGQPESDRGVPGGTPAENKEAGDARDNTREETGRPVATADNGSGEKQTDAECQNENEAASSTIAATDDSSVTDGRHCLHDSVQKGE